MRSRDLAAPITAHLELPLGGHHLGVGAADPDAGVQTGAVVSLHNVTPIHLNISMAGLQG